jgi:hypothetical protein
MQVELAVGHRVCIYTVARLYSLCAAKLGQINVTCVYLWRICVYSDRIVDHCSPIMHISRCRAYRLYTAPCMAVDDLTISNVDSSLSKT